MPLKMPLFSKISLEQVKEDIGRNMPIGYQFEIVDYKTLKNGGVK